jgi:hypothetical protein
MPIWLKLRRNKTSTWRRKNICKKSNCYWSSCMKRDCVLYEVPAEAQDTVDDKNKDIKCNCKSRWRYLSVYEAMISINCLLLM